MHRPLHYPRELPHETNRSLFGAFVYVALVPAVISALSYPTMAAFVVGTLLALWAAVRFGRPVVRNARTGGSEHAVPATAEVDR